MILTLRTAHSGDVSQIAALLIANSVALGGTLYGDYSDASVAAWIRRRSPTFIALYENRLAGVLVTASPSEATAPPVMAMLTAWPADADAWIYGPVCISSEMRGKHVLDALVNYARTQFYDRQGLLFINATNIRSIRAHKRLGMSVVAGFILDNENFLVMTV